MNLHFGKNDLYTFHLYIRKNVFSFRFPDDPEQRKKWIFIIELYNNQKIDWEQSMRICALHFGAGCFTKPDQLMEGAKPSVFKHAVARRQMEM